MANVMRNFEPPPLRGLRCRVLTAAGPLPVEGERTRYSEVNLGSWPPFYCAECLRLATIRRTGGTAAINARALWYAAALHMAELPAPKRRRRMLELRKLQLFQAITAAKTIDHARHRY